MIKKKIVFYGLGLALLASVLLLFNPPISQAGIGFLYGRVTKCDNGQGIDGVSVRTNGGGSTVTTQGGYYIMIHPSGTFNVAFSKNGYLTETRGVTISDGNGKELNICMTKSGC